MSADTRGQANRAGPEQDYFSRIDPELAAPLVGLAGGGLSNLQELQAARAGESLQTVAMRANREQIEGVRFKDHGIRRSGGSPSLNLRVFRPSNSTLRDLPALLWLHGGGLILGNAESDYLLCSYLSLLLQCVVASVDYRLAPEHPYPAAIDDAHDGLRWLHANARTLGAAPDRLAIGGASAGAGLAACLALLNRDRENIPLALQLLIYPMLDDRNQTPSSFAVADERFWTRSKNLFSWRSYLAGCGPEVPPYAAAARAGNLAALPPAYLAVGELDLFIDEDIDYAARLTRAGVPTELHVYPGAYHSFEGVAPGAAVSQRFIHDYLGALKRAWRLPEH